MTTVLDNKLDRPAIHAFVIGVGDYPFLDGGKQHTPGAQTWGLGQLEAAPQSALAFARWLASELRLLAGPDGPDRPLGSIELVISQAGKPARFKDPRMPGSKSRSVERASIENVKRAFDVWFERATTHEENIAVFFFSGHGFNNMRDCLLLEGFDGKKKNPFEDVIDFENFVRGMEMCLARQQIFFNDACRNNSDELRKRVGEHRGEPLVILVDPKPSELDRDYAIVRATAFGQPAYALPAADKKQPRLTRFTSALLKVLRGAGCIEANARWEVRAEGIVTAVKALLQHETNRLGVPAQLAKLGGELAGFALHVPEQPLVPAIVRCDPEDDSARFSCASKQQPIDKRAQPARGAVWEVDLLLDREYEFVATFDNGVPDRKVASVTVPPLHEVKLR